jgi:cytochrome c oxidase subunit 3
MAGAGEVLASRAARAREQTTAFVGMAIFLASWAMMFAALFFGYGLLRAKAASWPPPGVPRLPVGLPLLNTGVLAASSAALLVGVWRARHGKATLLAPALLAALLLGGTFLALQTELWTEVRASGLVIGSGQYASVFYSLTWVHAAHVAVGLLALAYLSVQALRGTYSPERHLPVRLWAMYWHFVGLVWLLLFLFVFLV